MKERKGDSAGQAFQDCDKARDKEKRRRARRKQLDNLRAAIVIGLDRPRPRRKLQLALDSFSLIDAFSLRSVCVPTRRIGALWYFRTSTAHFCLTFSNEVGLTTEREIVLTRRFLLCSPREANEWMDLRSFQLSTHPKST